MIDNDEIDALPTSASNDKELARDHNKVILESDERITDEINDVKEPRQPSETATRNEDDETRSSNDDERKSPTLLSSSIEDEEGKNELVAVSLSASVSDDMEDVKQTSLSSQSVNSIDSDSAENTQASTGNEDEHSSSNASQKVFHTENLSDEYNEEEKQYLRRCWSSYDDLIILSLFALLGIAFRLLAAVFFRRFDDVFNEDSALFTNLPLNCVACYIMGLLSTGDEIMKIVYAKFGNVVSFVDGNDYNQVVWGGKDEEEDKKDTQVVDSMEEHDDNHIQNEIGESSERRYSRRFFSLSPQPPTNKWKQRAESDQQMREVQVRALERRIRASPCLFLFPTKKESVDVVEHYTDNGYTKTHTSSDISACMNKKVQHSQQEDQFSTSPADTSTSSSKNSFTFNDKPVVNIKDGWKVDNTLLTMQDTVLLGLRVGFCGAVSTFSSWNSDMVNLLRRGHVSAAFVGYMIGILMPMVMYRFGQHTSIYSFIWRCRRETKQDERRGYGLKLKSGDFTDVEEFDDSISKLANCRSRIYEKMPSTRTMATIVLVLTLLGLLCSMIFVSDSTTQRYLASLLFAPFGVIARWKLSTRFNRSYPSFPLGTFISNMTACLLSGTLGSILAGRPKSREEQVILSSIIGGFAGSLSTLATFLVEVLDRMDPILLRFDGVKYAFVTVFWAMLIGLLGSQAKSWADIIDHDL